MQTGIDRKFLNLLSDQLDYEIGETVYHKLDTTEGIVTNYQIFGDDGTINYVVCFGIGSRIQLDPIEITKDKPTIIE